jgi:hypothetical protein
MPLGTSAGFCARVRTRQFYLFCIPVVAVVGAVLFTDVRALGHTLAYAATPAVARSTTGAAVTTTGSALVRAVVHTTTIIIASVDASTVTCAVFRTTNRSLYLAVVHPLACTTARPVVGILFLADVRILTPAATHTVAHAAVRTATSATVRTVSSTSAVVRAVGRAVTRVAHVHFNGVVAGVCCWGFHVHTPYEALRAERKRAQSRIGVEMGFVATAVK